MRKEDKEWRRAYNLDRYYRLRQEVLADLGGKCQQCGSVDRLEVDHYDRTKKTLDVSTVAGHVSKEALAEELLNCQALCHSCHMEKSIRERGRVPLAEQKHGTLSKYTHGKCRCEECRAAVRTYEAAYRIRSGRTKGILPRVGLAHGTANAYAHYKCRCPVCKDAHNARIRDYLKRRRANSGLPLR